jgi:uracil-DNA glycosylase
LTGVKKNIDELHKQWVTYPQGFTLMPSWDPLYLIKRPETKKTVWEDLKKITQHL